MHLFIFPEKRYADSSFFKTAYNTYPTIDDQKTMARKIASILEGGDPTQKGSTKFEKQRQRAEKYTIENEASTLSPAAYRPLRTLQTNETYQVQSMVAPPTLTVYTNSSNLPNPIKHSLNQAQYINPLRYVGAPEEFKQMHMQVRSTRKIGLEHRRFSCLGTCYAYQCSTASSNESCCRSQFESR